MHFCDTPYLFLFFIVFFLKNRYLSCNGQHTSAGPPSGGGPPPIANVTDWGNYTCICDNEIDRVLAHQTAAQINMYCPPPHGEGGLAGGGGGPTMAPPPVRNPCVCLPGSLAASAVHTGWMPVSLPWSFEPLPPNTPTVPYGGWFHHPAASKCEDDGTAVGVDGCTWRRSPVAVMLYGKQLLENGWNDTDFGRTVVPNAAVYQNAAALRKAVDTINAPCCGC